MISAEEFLRQLNLMPPPPTLLELISMPKPLRDRNDVYRIYETYDFNAPLPGYRLESVGCNPDFDW